MQIYTLKEITENSFEVIGSDGTILKNHNNKPYPYLSENISRNLIQDLNDIAKRYYKTNENNKEIENAVFNNLLVGISGEVLRESFAYCLISTMMEYAEVNIGAELEVVEHIQWDRLFRLNINPNGGELEMNATKKARDFFNGKWKNFGLNYSKSFEEMNENNIEFVSDDLTNEIQKLVDELKFSHKIAVNILYNFFEYFSISIPILWISGKINDHDFIKAYWALQYGSDIAELNEEEYEEPRFLMNRLLFLKTILWGYLWEDETLPGINRN